MVILSKPSSSTGNFNLFTVVADGGGGSGGTDDDGAADDDDDTGWGKNTSSIEDDNGTLTFNVGVVIDAVTVVIGGGEG